MESRRWVRGGAAAGIAGVVVALSTITMIGAPPKSSASASLVDSYLNVHQGALKATGVLVVLSAALLLWFGATLGWVIHRREPSSALGLVVAASTVALSVFLVWDGLLGTVLAFLSSQGDAGRSQAATALWDLQNGVVMPGGYGMFAAVFLVAVGAACLRGVVGARWVGIMALVLAGLSAAGSVAGLTSLDGGTNSPVSFAPAAATSLITIVVGVMLMRRPAWEGSPPIGPHTAAPSPLESASSG